MSSNGTGLTLSEFPYSRRERTFIRSAQHYILTQSCPSCPKRFARSLPIR